MRQFSREQWYIFVSFATIYIVWGATYLFVSFAVQQLSPFYLSGIRFLLATITTISLGYFLSTLQPPTWRQAQRALGVGIFFLGFGSTGVAWALKTVDSGFAALLIAAEPLIVVMMMWAVDRYPPPSRSLVGVFLGISGIYLLVSQRGILVSSDHWLGIMAIAGSMLCWGAGTIYISRSDLPKDPYFNNSLQMLSGSLTALIMSFFLEPVQPSFTTWSFTTLLSVFILFFFGSVLAFSAFNYLLTKVSPEKVATNTYVNPVIALFLGWMFNQEKLTLQSLVAAAVMLTGVYFIHTAKRKSPSKQSEEAVVPEKIMIRSLDSENQ